MIKRNSIYDEIEEAGKKCKEAREELRQVREITLPLLQSWKDCRLQFSPYIHFSIEDDDKHDMVPSQLFAEAVQLPPVNIRDKEGEAVRLQANLLIKGEENA